jgi:glyoxylase-like metal-dependent hydrolase (beta-lactamase superfamily II)
MEIAPNVHRVPGVRGANAYLLSGPELTLVDCGMPGNTGTIVTYLEGLGRSPAELTRIVITHYHVDHIGSLAALQARTGAQVLAHPGDVPVIAGEHPQPGPRGAVMGLLFRLVPAMSQVTPVSVDVALEHGHTLELLGGATVVHAPGHTPGSIVLHLPAEKVLITGDVVDHRRSRLGPPPKHFTTDMDQAIRSLRRVAALEFDVLCPGHGPPVVGGAAEVLQAMLEDLG